MNYTDATADSHNIQCSALDIVALEKGCHAKLIDDITGDIDEGIQTNCLITDFLHDSHLITSVTTCWYILVDYINTIQEENQQIDLKKSFPTENNQ